MEPESGGGGDQAFSERYGELVTAYGGHVDQRLADEFAQLAEEYGHGEILEAIRACRAANLRPYPSHLRKQLPAREPSRKPVPLDDLLTFPGRPA